MQVFTICYVRFKNVVHFRYFSVRLIEIGTVWCMLQFGAYSLIQFTRLYTYRLAHRLARSGTCWNVLVNIGTVW